MNVLLIGGKSSLMEAVIDKLNKEGNRIYVLTGSRYKTETYRKVFETYYFSYDSDSLNDIFDSVRPEVILYMGAYDTNFDWRKARQEAVKYSSGLLNILLASSAIPEARFIYLSSDDVYQESSSEDIREEETVTARSLRGMTISLGEQMCQNYKETMGIDLVILRLDHLYGIPRKGGFTDSICFRMCFEALKNGEITANKNHRFSLLYVSDAVEFIYKVVSAAEHQRCLYHVSSGKVMNETELARLIKQKMWDKVKVVETDGGEQRIVLSNEVFDREFRIRIFHPAEEVMEEMADYMRRHRGEWMEVEEEKKGFLARLYHMSKGILRALVPYIENMVCFIPFFMLNNRAVGSEYFANLDFYLLYVLLFAIVYGQQQATFSAVMAVAGYCFRQMYHRSGFEVMLDYNTYVWMAQLFILGLAVGYMRDRIRVIKGEDEKEIDYLSGQLGDIQDINTSNVRSKDILETQIVNQNDSFGKIYEITSSLDKYEPQEVLFYAAEVLSRLMDSEDVAVYSVANRSYARLFSATSAKARELGNSINYQELTDMYEELKEKKVYINKNLDERYPLMANAIYSEDEMQLILMVWGIPWERMTLGQANMLTVVGYLIQNAVIRANRYLEALEHQRYIEGTNILEPSAFSSLVKAYMNARAKGLTECAILLVEAEQEQQEEAGRVLGEKLRQTDYLGRLGDGRLYALLSNTSDKDAEYVIRRFQEAGYPGRIQEEISV